jgi:dienelactone hydrolase
MHRLPLFPGIQALLVLCSLPMAAAEPLPPEMQAWFRPPSPELQEPGTDRSPLVFADGSRVTTAADWLRRRAEIRQQWDAVMGEWPPLLERPRVEILSREARDGFEQCKVRVEVAGGSFCGGYLLIPPGKEKLPAVLVPFYEPETSAALGTPVHHDFAYQLARRGFVALAIGSPSGDARKPQPGQMKWQPLSYLAYVAANCGTALAQLPNVDPARIGVVGHSYGGKWAMFASCLDERFACAVWSDGGIVFDESRANVNYWEPWYLGASEEQKRKHGIPSADNPRTGAYAAMIERGMDLHELHALMAPRPFVVSGGSEDPPERWLALNHTVAVNRLLGFENRVAMTNRPQHNPTAESAGQIYRFFEHFLKPGSASATSTPAR